MNLLTQFGKVLQTYEVQKNTPILVAISGGLDSVILSALCEMHKLNFALAHCNFSLRGEESEGDEKFVRAFAAERGVNLFVEKKDAATFASENKCSIQEAARMIRYEFFERLCTENNFVFTLMAHHADDQVETILLNFFRGTGLDGITGMPVHNPANARVLRPLLAVSRDDIETFAKEHGLQWREDSSNASEKYSRNFFRHSIIPAIAKIYPQAAQNVLQNSRRLQGVSNLYGRLVEQLKSKLLEKKGGEVRVPVLKLIEWEHTALLYEILKEFSFTEKQVAEVSRLLTAATGKYVSSKTHNAIKHGKWLVISPVTSEAEIIIIEKENESIPFAEGTLIIREGKGQAPSITPAAAVAQIDLRNITWPLILRKRKQGDYFYPLGMRKKKKISRFLIDGKLSKSDKEKIWVLESAQRIIWVVGQRMDDRFKITPSTTQYLQLTLSSP